jgi:AraC-like DNA-binding protein
MNEFELFSPDGEDIEIVQAVPERFRTFCLPGFKPVLAQCSFGDMLFNKHEGDGFEIWKSDYLIGRPARVVGRSKRSVLEFTLMYEDSFSIDWKNLVAAALPYKQIEMYYAPSVENTVRFPGERQFATIDFHFQEPLLDQYAGDFPLLEKFMDKVHNKKPARLFDGRQFSSPKIDALIKDMLSYRFVDALAPRYYDSYAHILLILLLERISGFNPADRKYSASDKEKAYEARTLLSTSLEKSYTIKQLCHVLHTNPYKLKTTFKHLFGVSIGKYKKSVLMEHARILLETTDYSMDEISFRLGYSSQQSFSTAFRNHFRNVPSHFRKRR